VPPNIHHALAQVQALQQTVIDGQRFRGWSGPARGVSGAAALIAAMVMGQAAFPANPLAHLAGWSVVFAIAMIANHGAMAYWFLFDPSAGRDWRKLTPVYEIAPSIIVGGVLTAAFLRLGQYDLLFGMWMALFGLTNLAARRVLPRSLTWVGTFYIAAGAVLLLTPGAGFTNPWPMGIVFFLGELAGGIILHVDRTRHFPRATGGRA
jgi:hypothetical protein